jgi:hypothetical protein
MAFAKKKTPFGVTTSHMKPCFNQWCWFEWRPKKWKYMVLLYMDLHVRDNFDEVFVMARFWHVDLNFGKEEIKVLAMWNFNCDF